MTQFQTPREYCELKDLWRQQIAHQMQKRARHGQRPYAVITALARGPLHDGLIKIRDLVYLVLYDESHGSGSPSIRFAAYGLSIVDFGLAIGGHQNIRLDKDLSIAPQMGAKGARFDLVSFKKETLSIALAMDRVLERHSRYPHLPRRSEPRWPAFWAGFPPAIAKQLELAGPEFEADFGKYVGSIAELPPRTLSGLVLVPLAYASHAWRHIATVFADLSMGPKRQVITLASNGRNLRDYQGAVAFDLVSSRFDACAGAKRPSRQSHQKPLLAVN